MGPSSTVDVDPVALLHLVHVQAVEDVEVQLLRLLHLPRILLVLRRQGENADAPFQEVLVSFTETGQLPVAVVSPVAAVEEEDGRPLQVVGEGEGATVDDGSGEGRAARLQRRPAGPGPVERFDFAGG